jgi:hypothetical protein
VLLIFNWASPYFFFVLVLAKIRQLSYAACYMRRRTGLGWALACCFAFSSLLPCASIPKQDRTWKRYYNPSFGYCVSYPSRWVSGEAFDGAGLFVKAGVSKFSRPLGSIDFGVLDSPRTDARLAPINLVEDLRVHLAGLRKFERAERMEILEQRELKFLGHSALFTRNRYYDPQERANWAEEVLFINRNGALYRLELECRLDQLSRFEPVFSQLMKTFQFDCAAKH